MKKIKEILFYVAISLNFVSCMNQNNMPTDPRSSDNSITNSEVTSNSVTDSVNFNGLPAAPAVEISTDLSSMVTTELGDHSESNNELKLGLSFDRGNSFAIQEDRSNADVMPANLYIYHGIPPYTFKFSGSGNEVTSISVEGTDEVSKFKFYLRDPGINVIEVTDANGLRGKISVNVTDPEQLMRTCIFEYKRTDQSEMKVRKLKYIRSAYGTEYLGCGSAEGLGCGIDTIQVRLPKSFNGESCAINFEGLELSNTKSCTGICSSNSSGSIRKISTDLYEFAVKKSSAQIILKFGKVN